MEDPQEVTPEAPLSNPKSESSQKAKSLKEPRRKNRIEWPKTSETVEWKRLDEALSELLQKALCGTVEAHRNLLQWLGTACDLSGTINVSLQDTLSGCKTALCQGRYEWRHDQVLQKLAEVVERKRQEASLVRQPGS